MMPRLVGHYFRGETPALLELWYKSIRKVSALVIPLVMVFLVSAEEFIALLFPDSYAGAVVPFRIYTVILLQRVASYSNMQKALGSTGDITRGAVYLFLINGLLSVPLVMWLGVAGPPLASLLANMFTWWYALDCIRRSLKIGFFQSFPFAFYLRTLAVAAVAALPALVLKYAWSLPAAAAFPVLALVYLLTYLMLARFSGVVGQEDWQRMLRALRLAR
jgi:O-antigen/teichoic acid export membrane protein